MPTHAVLVHLPIGLWTFGTLILCIAVIGPHSSYRQPAWIILLIATIAAIASASTGQSDLMRLNPSGQSLFVQHQRWGNALPWLMGTTLVLRIHTQLARKNVPETWWTIPCILITASLWWTAYLGTWALFQGALRLT
ncbi:MAG: hypothetical protein KDC35_04125 [Acidobacteria bacterium]|nr:hypothetical protein [Acidobacteriota bacterium]